MANTSKPPPNITSPNFWLCTIGLLLVWSVVIAIATPTPALAPTFGTPSVNAPLAAVESRAYKCNDIKNTQNCKGLCEHCGCMGFYCGEECICECNKENSDTECIGTMQRNARKMAIPFELLIQGPSANSFVRNALQFEQNADRKNVALPLRHKRSTVVIYKPAVQNSLDGKCETKTTASATAKEVRKSVVGRHKRSVKQLDWLDLTRNLVRPAPRGGYRQSEDRLTPEEPAHRRRFASGGMDRSWFTQDNSKSLIRPAPLRKSQKTTPTAGYRYYEDVDADKDEDVDADVDANVDDEDVADVDAEDIADVDADGDNNDRDDQGDTDDRMSSDFKIPQAFKNTNRNMHFTKRIRNRIASDDKENLEQLQSPVLFPPSKQFGKVFNGLALQGPPRPRPLPAIPPKTDLPWFRPGRFLQRIHQAINEPDQ